MKYTKHQDKAIHHERKNILVSASAGSGKTGVLKARVLRKIQDGVDIDQLIVLTFTEAAAAEMKSRIIQELTKLGLKDQLIKLDNAIISTFDAFTLRLVRTYHYLLDLPSDVGISDQLLIDMERQTVLETVIKDYYKSQDFNFNQFIKGMFSGGDQFLYQSILTLAHAMKKMPNYQSIISNYQNIYNEDMAKKAYEKYMRLIKEDIYQLYQYFLAYYEDNIGLYDEKCDLYLQTCKSKYEDILNAKSHQDRVQAIVDFKLPSKPRKPKNEDTWLEKEPYHGEIKKIRQELDDAHIFDIDPIKSWKETWPKVSIMLEMTQTYLNRLALRQREKNLYSFDDMMNFAIQLFEDHQDIRFFYQNNINEILIDEYQDTNDLQDYFVSLIANDNIFMVGDVKQSIYRFRDANPKNFMRLLDMYQDEDQGDAIRLLENFRSNRFLLRQINALFEALMSKKLGGVDYKDKHQLVSGYNDDHGLNQKNDPIHMLYYDRSSIEEKYEDLTKEHIEAHIVARDIQRKIDQRQRIFNGDKHRPISYEDITILVDRKTSFDTYQKVLVDFSIPIDVYHQDVFTETESIIFVQAFLTLLECLYQYKDQDFLQALYSVARSFVYQMDDQTILHFLIKDDASIKSFLQDKDFQRLVSDLQAILPLINVIPNVDLIEAIFEQTNIYHQIAYLDMPDAHARKLDYFRHLMAGQKASDFDDLMTYLRFIQEQKDLDINYTEAKKDKAAVKLMSIHQSKGLQFPIVYMMGLSKQFNFTENKAPFNFSPDYGILTYGNQDGIYRAFLEKLYFKESKQEDTSEKIRLLYVALTRAKEEINMVLEAKENFKHTKLTYNNYLEMLYNGYDLQAYDVIQDIIMPDPSKQAIIKERGQSITHKQFHFDTDIENERTFSKSDHLLLDEDIKEALAYGEDVHEYLETIDFDHLQVSIKDFPRKIKQSIEYLVETPLFKDLKNPVFYQEYEFILEVDGKSRLGIIDLLIKDEDKYIILDYKLKNIEDDAYKKQILAYKAFVSTMTDLKIEGYLYALLEQDLKQVI